MQVAWDRSTHRYKSKKCQSAISWSCRFLAAMEAFLPTNSRGSSTLKCEPGEVDQLRRILLQNSLRTQPSR